MQRRLTVALVGVALASVLLVGAGVLILAQIGARTQTEAETIERLDFLADIIDPTGDQPANGRQPARADALQRAIPALGLSGANLAIVGPGGEVRLTATNRLRPRARAIVGDEPAATLDETALDLFDQGEAVIVDGTGSDVTAIRSIPTPASVGPDALGDSTLALVVQRPVVTVGRDARIWFLVSAGAVLAGSLVVSWLLARRFSAPVRAIQRATATVAGGDFSARVEVDGDDELADLGRSVNDMAAELERSKSLDRQFLLSVSHDLRTPLTAITGYAEALRDGAVTDPVHTGEIIGTHATRLDRLVGDLLDLAKLDANRFRLERRRVDAGVVVGRTVAGLMPIAVRNGLTLAVERNGPALVDADPDRLAQIVGNLIDNALRFATERVVVDITATDADAVISVTDDGPGIDEADLPYVFERLYQGSARPERAENPSGMGLAIVRELTTALGGTVEARLGPAGGTIMTVRLPLATDPVESSGSGTQPPGSAQG